VLASINQITDFPESTRTYGLVAEKNIKNFAGNFRFHMGGKKTSQTFKRAVGNALKMCPEYLNAAQEFEGIDLSMFLNSVRDMTMLPVVSDESSEDEVDSDIMDAPCAVCCSSGNEDYCLLCDSCDTAMHYNCVGLSSIPVGDWSCPWCVKKTTITSKLVSIPLPFKLLPFFVSPMFSILLQQLTPSMRK
jgi:hypothetical protein